MAGLHLRVGPRQHGLSLEALGMVEAGDRLVELGAVGRHERPEGQRHLLAGGHADAAAQRHDGIEHEALAAAQPCVTVEGGGAGDGAAAADEGAAVGLGFGLAGQDGAARDEMGERDVGLARRALAAGGVDGAVLAADLGLDEHLRKGRMRAVGGFGRQYDFGVGRHVDMAVRLAVVEDRDAAALAIALVDDDAFELGAQRADGLDEVRLVVGEEGLRDLALGAARLRRRRPPIAGLDVGEEEEGAGAVLDEVRLPARHGEVVEAAIAGAARRHHHRVVAVGKHVDGR